MTRSAESSEPGSAPEASSASSTPSESAWLTRRPNVTTAYFTGSTSRPVFRHQCTLPDIATILHALERNGRDAFVRAFDRSSEIGRSADDGHDASACGNNLSVTARRARMKHGHARNPLCAIEATNDLAH